jgi:hypothetical protein
MEDTPLVGSWDWAWQLAFHLAGLPSSRPGSCQTTSEESSHSCYTLLGSWSGQLAVCLLAPGQSPTRRVLRTAVVAVMWLRLVQLALWRPITIINTSGSRWRTTAATQPPLPNFSTPPSPPHPTHSAAALQGRLWIPTGRLLHV